MTQSSRVAHATMNRDNPFETHLALVHEGAVLPAFWMLMPASWERAPTQVCRPIISGLTLPKVPLVAVTHFIGDPNVGTLQRIHIRTERLAAMGASVAEVEGVAWRNLCRRPVTWEQAADGMLMCSQDFLAAEHILDPAFMELAAATLGARDAPLLVAIPSRTMLLAVRFGTTHHAQQQALAKMARLGFERAGMTAITPWLFMVKSGRIVCLMEPM